jgi:hypothetical protein
MSRRAGMGPAGASPIVDDIERRELDLLADQLTRMRGMLFGYSDLFFKRIRDWGVITIVLLVLGSTQIAPAAVVIVPFLVPFAFLETAYLFFYTVFARRHAEYLERAINARFGHDVLIAHRLEAAYFYPPEAPKIAALSFGDPLGMMSASTIGYTVSAGLLWTAGMAGTISFAAAAGGLAGILPVVAIVWTVAVAGYLVWESLTRRAEDRLVAELERGYLAPVESGAPPAGPGSD